MKLVAYVDPVLFGMLSHRDEHNSAWTTAAAVNKDITRRAVFIRTNRNYFSYVADRGQIALHVKFGKLGIPVQRSD